MRVWLKGVWRVGVWLKGVWRGEFEAPVGPGIEVIPSGAVERVRWFAHAPSAAHTGAVAALRTSTAVLPHQAHTGAVEAVRTHAAARAR